MRKRWRSPPQKKGGGEKEKVHLVRTALPFEAPVLGALALPRVPVPFSLEDPDVNVQPRARDVNMVAKGLRDPIWLWRYRPKHGDVDVTFVERYHP